MTIETKKATLDDLAAAKNCIDDVEMKSDELWEKFEKNEKMIRSLIGYRKEMIADFKDLRDEHAQAMDRFVELLESFE